MHAPIRTGLRSRHLFSFCAALGLTAGAVSAQMHPAVGVNHAPAAEHVTQQTLNDMVGVDPAAAFLFAFDHGDELFEFEYNALDGGGANVGDGQRFTRLPRADLNGPGEWATHIPARATGPNANSCVSCHNQPVADGAGGPSSNAIRDPLQSGDPGLMINRNTPHLHGMGALQRLAEEMTADLHEIRDDLIEEAAKTGQKAGARLSSKGVGFGALQVKPDGTLLTGRVRGVAADLIVRPFQWKGNFAGGRFFNMDAAHQEMGVQGSETAGLGVDGDGDGVVDELTYGDATALTIYLAAQPRPLTRRELASVGEIPALTQGEIDDILAGEELFAQVGCTSCHVPSLPMTDAIFSEPSQHSTHRDAVFAGNIPPTLVGVDPATAITFDLTADQPDNMFTQEGGEVVHLGAFPSDGTGGGFVGLFGDLKLHEMGPALAESIDETGAGASVWMTKELWGVGVTAPYLHDGRATTITEAVDYHGGESALSREAFFSLEPAEQQQIIAFLNDMIIFLPAE